MVNPFVHFSDPSNADRKSFQPAIHIFRTTVHRLFFPTDKQNSSSSRIKNLKHSMRKRAVSGMNLTPC